MTLLKKLLSTTSIFLFIAVTSLGLQLSALFFQYAMGLEPCIMCVYQRVVVMGLFFTSAIGFLLEYKKIPLAPTLLMVANAWIVMTGVNIAKEHIEMQTSDSLFFSCDIVPNFPEYLPLHEWIPSVFAATGDCGDINWDLFGLSMPTVVGVVMYAYLALIFIWVLNRIFNKKKPQTT
jgi:disulfide bond formation protein DsbB